jgi:RNA polymerase II C-terminal domain phosphatase-like 3/4
MLAVALRVLLAVHGGVFAALAVPPRRLPSGDAVAPNWDARAVLGTERARVLAGCRIAFSRVVPLGAPPAEHPLWRLAERLGAACATAVGAGTTHVVAAPGPPTDKVLAARAAGAAVVSPGWLQCSATLWRRADEAHFSAQIEG